MSFQKLIYCHHHLPLWSCQQMTQICTRFQAPGVLLKFLYKQDKILTRYELFWHWSIFKHGIDIIVVNYMTSKVMCFIWLLILDRYLYLSGMSFGVAPKMNTKMACIQKRSDCFLIYDNHIRFDSQHNWGNLYDHLMSMRVFILIMIKIFIWAPKIMRKVATTSIWIC